MSCNYLSVMLNGIENYERPMVTLKKLLLEDNMKVSNISDK